MATFLTHAVIGAGVRAATAKAIGMDTEWIVWSACLGLVEGATPDALDWIASLFGAERWKLYSRMHSGNLRWLGLIFWGYGLHLLFDLPFHRRPGENWWPRLGWLEMAGACVGMILLWFAFYVQ